MSQIIMSAQGGSASGRKKIAKIIFSSLILTLVLSAVLVLPQASSAETITGGLANFIGAVPDLPGDAGTANLPATVGKIIQIFLGFLGVLGVVLIIYAGFLWMTAGGDSGKVDKAKDYIKNTVIGIVIILAAYIITSFVIEQVTQNL